MRSFQSMQQGGTNTNSAPSDLAVWLRRAAYAFWVIVLLVILGKSVDYNSSDKILVYQSYPSGELNLKVGNGIILSPLADWYRFARQISVAFSDKQEDKAITKSFFVRYNDGGTAHWGGTARFTMPDTKMMFYLLRSFGSEENLINELLIPGMREICTGTAGLLTTEESYTTKRSMISEWCRDQALEGVYLTDIKYVEQIDEFGKRNRLPVYGIADDPKTKKHKRKSAMFKKFGIDCELFVIPEIDFEQKINDQIGHKMQFQTQLQVTDAQILTAEQKLNEVEASGEKNVTVATMAQRQVKEKAVQQVRAITESRLLEAQGDSGSTVNQLAATKYLVDASIKEAQGQAERRRKEMQGDKALGKRLEVYGAVIDAWTQACIERIDNSPKVAASWDPNYFYNLLQGVDQKVRKDLGLNLSFGGAK